MSAVDVVINAVVDFLIAYLIIEFGLQVLQRITNKDEYAHDWQVIATLAVAFVACIVVMNTL